MNMKAIKVVREGGSLPFSFDLGGLSLSGWTCTIEVRKFPGDTALISRAVAADGLTWPSIITSTETDALGTGHFYLVARLANATTDEEQQIEDRFRVTEALV